MHQGFLRQRRQPQQSLNKQYVCQLKKTHLYTTLHICILCRRPSLSHNEHPQSAAPKGKTIVLSAEDHGKAVQEGIEIVNDINDTTDDI
jgi:hypothetical protein